MMVMLLPPRLLKVMEAVTGGPLVAADPILRNSVLATSTPVGGWLVPLTGTCAEVTVVVTEMVPLMVTGAVVALPDGGAKVTGKEMLCPWFSGTDMGLVMGPVVGVGLPGVLIE